VFGVTRFGGYASELLSGGNFSRAGDRRAALNHC
jgi:hypothetical protein